MAYTVLPLGQGAVDGPGHPADGGLGPVKLTVPKSARDKTCEPAGASSIHSAEDCEKLPFPIARTVQGEPESGVSVNVKKK